MLPLVAQSIVGHDVQGGRPALDFYPTPASATQALLDRERFENHVWEPACGEGHMVEVLEKNSYRVLSSDIEDYGFGTAGVDFLKADLPDGARSIITNPPFKYAGEFAQHGLDILPYGGRLALFAKLSFLEGQKRGKFLRQNPPQKVWVFSKRQSLYRNGKPMKNGGMIAFAWFVWTKGVTDETKVNWITS